MKEILHRLALNAERFADRFQRTQSEDRIIDAYAGYATQEHLVLRGRVLTALRRDEPNETASKLTNLRQMVSLFLTDEVADVRVHAQGAEAITDEEGYFTLLLPRPEQTGWVDVEVHIDQFEDTTTCSAFVPAASAKLMVVSDIDDTVLETGAYSLARNLWTSMTGNALTRRIYPDAISLISGLAGQDENPVYYVSSSPWNLYRFLTQIFERNGLVRAPLFLRDLGLSETKFITEGHGDHKGGHIDMLLRVHDGLPAVLMGDTGQKDAAIYADMVEKHPGRIAVVVLRETRDGSDEADLKYIRAMEAAGVTVFHGPQFPTAVHVLEAVEGTGRAAG